MAFLKRIFQQTVAKLRRSSKTKEVVIPVGEPSLDKEHHTFQQGSAAIPENSEELTIGKPPTGEIDQTSRQVPTVKAERSEEKTGLIPVNSEYSDVVIQTSNVDNPKTNAEQDKPIKDGFLHKPKEEFSSLVPQPERKKKTFFTIQSLPCRESLHHRRKASRDQRRPKLFRFPKKCNCSWCASLSPLAIKCRACAELYFPGWTAKTAKKPLPFKCKCDWCQTKSSSCSLCGRLIGQTTNPATS